MLVIRTSSARSARFGGLAVPALFLAIGVVLAATMMPAQAQDIRDSYVLPDLKAIPATNPTVATYTDAEGTRLLLRFDGHVYNGGRGALEIRGSSPVDREMTTVTQRIYDADGNHLDIANSPAPRLVFEPEDGHNHWHLQNAAAYSLWDRERTAEVAPSQKVGFCLIDSTRVDSWAPSEAFYTIASGNFCAQNAGDVESIVMGVSAGWRDFYHRSLAFQWVDISDVQPGAYSLRADVDPDGVIAETDENNPPAFRDTVVPGYRATSFSTSVLPLLTSTVTLRSERFGSPGSVQYRIDEAPRHGTLNQQVGVWFDSSTVTYRPRFGYTGQDSFRFSAREKGNPFPLSQHSATASLGVGAVPLQASGDEATPTTEGTQSARRAPDVPERLPVLGTSILAAPQIAVQHGDLVVRTITGQAGVLAMTVLDGQRIVGECRADVLASRAHSCLLAGGFAEDQARDLRVVASLWSGDRLLASRQTPG